MNDDTAEKRLRTIYNTVLGANVGFLPFLALHLLTKADIDIITAFAIWLLTTIIIANEWWVALDLWSNCLPTWEAKWLTVYQVFFNLIYVIPLLGLPFTILFESADKVELILYAFPLIFLPIIDAIIVIPYFFQKSKKYPGKKFRLDVLGYILSDIAAIGLFISYTFLIDKFSDPDINSQYLLQRVFVLFGIYVFEYFIFHLFNFLFSSQKSSQL